MPNYKGLIIGGNDWRLPSLQLLRQAQWTADSQSELSARATPLYWQHRFSATVAAILAGITKANPGLVRDNSSNLYRKGWTDLTPSNISWNTAFCEKDHSHVVVASPVWSNLRKNNWIEYRVTDKNAPEQGIYAADPYFCGMRVIVDDATPNKDGVFDTYLVGPGLIRYEMPALHNSRQIIREYDQPRYHLLERVGWEIQVAGHDYVGEWTPGGPTNQQLAQGENWKRRDVSYHDIPFRCIRTRERPSAVQAVWTPDDRARIQAADCGSASGLPTEWYHNAQHGTWHIKNVPAATPAPRPSQNIGTICECGSGSNAIGPGHSHWCVLHQS